VRGPALFAARGIALPPLAAALALGLVGLAALVAALLPGSLRAVAALGLAFAVLYGTAIRVAMPALDVRNSVAPFARAARAVLVDGARGGMIEWRAQYSFHMGPLDAAVPGNADEVLALAARLDAADPYFVVVSERRAPLLLRQVRGEPPVEALRATIGPDPMLVLANRAALGLGRERPQ
jgi:hypothetical protein